MSGPSLPLAPLLQEELNERKGDYFTLEADAYTVQLDAAGGAISAGSDSFGVAVLARPKDQSESPLLVIKRMSIFDTSMKSALREALWLVEVGGCHHVVQLQDMLRGDSHAGLVMPFFEHVHFADALNAGKFDGAHTTTYMIHLFDALAHVHGKRVVHRDIKPSNVMCDLHRGGRCVI